MERLNEISSRRAAAYARVGELAREFLPLNVPCIFEILYTAFQEFLKIDAERDRFIFKYAREYCNPLQAIVSSKTIADIYWQLPANLQDEWDKVPELRSWKEKYR